MKEWYNVNQIIGEETIILQELKLVPSKYTFLWACLSRVTMLIISISIIK